MTDYFSPECACGHERADHFYGYGTGCLTCCCLEFIASGSTVMEELEATEIPDAPTNGGDVQERGSVVTADRPPLTVVCPECRNQFEGRMPGHVYGSNWEFVPCRTCAGVGMIEVEG